MRLISLGAIASTTYLSTQKYYEGSYYPRFSLEKDPGNDEATFQISGKKLMPRAIKTADLVVADSESTE